MIYTIENTSKGFICGFFSTKQEAEKYMNKIDIETNYDIKNYRITPTHLSFYPIYILTSQQGYIYTNNRQEIINRLISLLSNRKEDNYIYFNIYRVMEDWQSHHIGKDYMGILNHSHINNWHLDIFEKTGEFNFFGTFDRSIIFLEKEYLKTLGLIKTTNNRNQITKHLEQLRTTIDTLKMCDRFHFNSNNIERIISLPYTKDLDDYYKIVTCKSENKAEWQELKLKKQEELILKDYDIIIKKKDI